MPNSYLNRTQEAATNRKKCTLSMWFKTTDSFGTRDYQLWETFYSASDRITVYIDSSDRLNWIDPSVSPGVHVGTNRKFRDPNAWYHVVFQIDTTESTASDRIKIYVNGVQETSLHSSTYYDQNDDAAFGTTNHINYIGKYGGNTNNNYNGYMSHVAFVDGSVVAPTVFGETDSTSGIWKFKPPSGVTWGNCGTHLKFENSAALGTDSSGNSNTFTVNGDLKQALDTPSNVYCTGNPLARYGGNLNYTNGNNFITGGGNNWTMGSATMGASTGKYYYELKILSAGTGSGYFKMGFQSADQSYANTGHTAESALDASYAFYCQNGNLEVRTDGAVISGYDTSTLGVSFSMNDIMCLAIDMDNKKAYFRKNGDAWIKSADPVNGTNGLDVSSEYPAGKGMVPNFAIYYPGTAALNFGNGYFGTTAITSAGSNGNGSLFEYDVPSGYYALNTKNINTYG